MRAKKQFGQHFLRDSTDARRIAGLLMEGQEAPPGRILEIGPGEGALTAALLERCPDVPLTVVEFDRDMVAELHRRFTNEERLEILQRDILRYDPQALGAGLRVAGNLPYNLSAPIIEWTTKYRSAIARAVYMLQREVAARLASQPGGKDWSPLGIMTQLHFDITREFDLGPERFDPPPAVHSSVVVLRRREFFPAGAPEGFSEVIRAGFASRRKILSKNLVNGLKLERRRVEEALEMSELALNIRAEQVTIPQFAALAKELFSINGDNH